MDDSLGGALRMTQNVLETKVGAFEARMLLRRRMLGVAGVKEANQHTSTAVEAELRTSVINCFNCDNDASCMDWLATAREGVLPPYFCQNHDTIMRLKAMSQSKGESK